MTRPLPLAEKARLAGATRRTRALRLGLVALLVGAVAASALAARHPESTETPYLPADSNGVIVLDLSASISSDTYAQIGETLDKLASGGGRYGLVLFSSVAYEALPPGTPARELQPIVSFFHTHVPGPGYAPSFPVNPWTESFSEGTAISRGLDLARQIIVGDRLSRSAVLLISDLDDDPGDLRRIAGSALALRQAHIAVHVVGLSPSSADAALFARLFPAAGAIEQAPAPGQPVSRRHVSTPWLLVGAAIAAALLLAAAELLAPLLRLPAEASA